MDALGKIVSLLSDESPRKRIAAAVVLGELGAKAPAVISALSKMAADEMVAIAEPAVEALGKLGAKSALPVLLDALERKDLAGPASAAIASLGEEALPALRERIAKASPEVRAAVSGVLPTARGSFAMVLDGLRGQPWEAVSRLALSVRPQLKQSPPQEREGISRQLGALVKKLKAPLAPKPGEPTDEAALRGAIKILGYLELPSTAKLIEPYLSPKLPAMVRVEAVTALRFALGEKPPAKSLSALVKLLEDADALVSRAARDTLTVVSGVPAGELLRLALGAKGELSPWAIERLRSMGAAKELLKVAQGGDRPRADAAVHALSSLPDTGPLLAAALAEAKAEPAAHALAEALERVQLSAKEVARLRAAGARMLATSFAVARRQLEPVRRAEPQAWAKLLREAARRTRDAARAEAILEVLSRSPWSTPDDRYAHASLLLKRSPLDPHPRARQADPALAELEKLAADGFPLATALLKDKSLDDDARYHAGFHFAEHSAPEVRAVGVAVLEELASGGRGKLARAAKNKLALLA